MTEEDDSREFKLCRGRRYLELLDAIHAEMVFDWYMEIGCRSGRTFAGVRSPTIAVDPFFKAQTNIIGAKPRLFVFQQTSDDFFATGTLEKLGIKLSFSFLDGMHLFEFLLRDFINTEERSDPDGVIALHDCVPFNHVILTRDLQNLPKGSWTGDVWKIIPILQKYRPDLTIEVLDARPTGLVLVHGLDPGNTVLRRHYDEILAHWTEMSLRVYGVERCFSEFDLMETDGFIAKDYPIFSAIRRDPAVIVKPIRVTK